MSESLLYSTFDSAIPVVYIAPAGRGVDARKGGGGCELEVGVPKYGGGCKTQTESRNQMETQPGMIFITINFLEKKTRNAQHKSTYNNFTVSSSQ